MGIKFQYNKEPIKEHISEMFESITSIEKEKYKLWYLEANQWCKNFAKIHELKHIPVMGV